MRKHLEGLGGLSVVHEDDGEVVHVAQVGQLCREVDVARHEDGRGG